MKHMQKIPPVPLAVSYDRCRIAETRSNSSTGKVRVPLTAPPPPDRQEVTLETDKQQESRPCTDLVSMPSSSCQHTK